MQIKIERTEKRFSKDAGSQVTKTPPDEEIIGDKQILPITRIYQDVKKRN